METNYNYDYTKIEEYIKESGISERKSFTELVNDLISGNLLDMDESILSYLKDLVLYEIESNWNIIMKIIVIAILTAIFTGFSKNLINSSISDTSFYVTYILLLTLLSSGFLVASGIVTAALNSLLDFMKVLLPTFFVAVGLSSGSITGTAFYKVSLATITLVEFIFLNLLVPMVYAFVVLNLINNIHKEEMLSKLAEFIKHIFEWLIKALYALVIGLNVVQGIVLPMVDSAKINVLSKAVSAIPGVGDVISGAGSVVISTATVVKNAIGVAGLIFLVIIVVVPIIKLIILSCMYRFAAGIIQPISEKRIVSSVGIIADGIVMLTRLMTTSMLLFFITISIICVATNTNYYGG